MRAILVISAFTAIALVVAGMSSPALAASVVVVENPEQFDSGFGFPPGTPDLWRSYDVYNNSDVEGPAVNIVALVVTNPQPLTEWIRGGWIAVDITSQEIWNQPMRGAFAEAGGDLSWSEFFGGAPFPGPANGYYLDYVKQGITLAFQEPPVGPGEESVGQFWFAGPIASEFLVAAAPVALDLGSINPAALTIFTGTASVPEPTACTLAITSAILAAAGTRRR